MTYVPVHGGLWEDMDAERFWVRPGVVAALADRGIEVVAPDRMVRVRGLSDTELAGLRMPVAVIPSLGGPFHQRRTVDALLALIPGATERPGAPESPRPDFPPHLDAFVAALATF